MRRTRGFTLLELMVSITVLVIVVMFVYTILQNSVRGQEIVRAGLREPKIQNAILSEIMNDFRYLWWDGFLGDAGFLGKKNGVDFVTARRSRGVRPEDVGGREVQPSPVTEVGYDATRPSSTNGLWKELWRREDYYVDDDPVRGGRYDLIYGRIRKFDLTYYPIPEEGDPEGRGLEEWDSRVKKKLPYAIVLEIEFDVDDPGEVSRSGRDEPEPYRMTRIIMIRSAYSVSRQPAGQPGAAPGTPGPPGAPR